MFFFFNDTATTEIYTLSLHDALPILLEWNQTVRNVLADNQNSSNGHGRGGRVIAAAGAKGGVGTTVVASHLAWDAARSDPTCGSAWSTSTWRTATSRATSTSTTGSPSPTWPRSART